jgi:hypothetical protein
MLALIDQGASLEMLRAALLAEQKDEISRDQNELADMRAKGAARQRRHRAGKKSQSDVTRRDAEAQKENPPDPHKKNNPPGPKGPSPRAQRFQEYTLPNWMPEGAWGAFVEVRRKKRMPVTTTGAQLLIESLDDFRRRGIDPADVLNTSVANGWGVLREPPNRQAATASGRPPTTAEDLERAAQFREDNGDHEKAAEHRGKLQAMRGGKG